MAEVRLLNYTAGIPLDRVDPSTDSARLLSIGIGTAGVPASGIADLQTGLNLGGLVAASYSGTALTLGDAAWASGIAITTAGNLILSPGSVNTASWKRITNAVTLQIDTAATSVTFNQVLAASGTPANWSISAQSVTTGTGASLTLAGGTGSVASGPVILTSGATEAGRFTASGLLLRTTTQAKDLVADPAADVSFCVRPAATASSGISIQLSSTGAVGGWQVVDAAGTGLQAYFITTGGSSSLLATNGFILKLSTGTGTAIFIPASEPSVHIGSVTVPAHGGSGVLSLGVVTTAPTASAADQALLYNVSGGNLNIMGKQGLSFLSAPAGAGAGAPVPIGYAGLASEVSECRYTIPEVMEDFITATLGGANGWTTAFLGTGAFAINTSLVDKSHWGIRQFDTGATAISTSAILLTLNQLFGTSGATSDFMFECLINIPALSTSLQEFKIYVGFQDGTGAGLPANGIIITYDRTVSVNWQFGFRKASVSTLTTSAVAVATGWNRLRFRKIGATLTFWVANGGAALTSLGTLANTNIPIVALGPVIKLDSTVGTTTKIMQLDYVKFSAQLDVTR